MNMDARIRAKWWWRLRRELKYNKTTVMVMLEMTLSPRSFTRIHWPLASIVLLSLVMGIVAVFVWNFLDTSESFYGTLEDARRDGAIERGWLPSWLPSSAKEIHEVHDIDSNRVYVSLRYNEADQTWFLRDCRVASVVPLDPAPRVEWWTPTRPWERHMFYLCANEQFETHLWLAVAINSNRAFIWTKR